MKIDFKHRSNLYLNCNRTSSVYRCNNVMSVTNSHRPVHAYRKLPEFALKLQKQKLFKRVITDKVFIF